MTEVPEIKKPSWESLNQAYLGEFDPGIAPHDPNLYSYDEEYQVEANGWEDVEKHMDELVQLYEDNGCVVVRNAFNPEVVSSVIDALNNIIDGKNESFSKAIEDTKHDMKDNSDGGCWNSILQFESAAKDVFDKLTTEEKRDYVRKLHGFTKHDPRFQTMAHHPVAMKLINRFLNVKEDAPNPEVFQDMILMKPPRVGREKPWHQDNAYFNLAPETRVVGVWIALDEAKPSNGCMHIIPKAHKDSTGQSVFWPHFNRRDWQICDKDIQESRNKFKVAAVCLKPGDMMIFTGLVPHGTPHNNAEARRRAVQFHYYPPATNRVPANVRLELYGGEGRNVQC